MPGRGRPATKSIAKKLTGDQSSEVVSKGKVGRYFRKDRVESAKKDGWSEVKTEENPRGKTLDVRTHTSDLVLMEK